MDRNTGGLLSMLRKKFYAAVMEDKGMSIIHAARQKLPPKATDRSQLKNALSIYTYESVIEFLRGQEPAALCAAYTIAAREGDEQLCGLFQYLGVENEAALTILTAKHHAKLALIQNTVDSLKKPSLLAAQAQRVDQALYHLSLFFCKNCPNTHYAEEKEFITGETVSQKSQAVMAVLSQLTTLSAERIAHLKSELTAAVNNNGEKKFKTALLHALLVVNYYSPSNTECPITHLRPEDPHIFMTIDGELFDKQALMQWVKNKKKFYNPLRGAVLFSSIDQERLCNLFPELQQYAVAFSNKRDNDESYGSVTQYRRTSR